ncbi:uncharacterized protein LOC127841770 [Dreissena polymorpha]|nr:uncharacterized protein LOC127841770 [Dreissena polymorpha]
MFIKTIIFIAFMFMEFTFVNGVVLRRKKRFILQQDTVVSPPTTKFPFPIPTTYPFPTLPNRITTPRSTPSPQSIYQQPAFGLVGMAAGSGYVPGSIPIAAILNSVPINCPKKREASSRRILLEEELMKGLYQALVGVHDASTVKNAQDGINNARNTISSAKAFQTSPEQRNATSLDRDIKVFKDWYESTRKYVFDKSSKHEKARMRVGKIHNPEYVDRMLQKLNITQYQLKLLLGLENEFSDIVMYLQRRGLGRHKRNADGSVSSYCHPRGASTADGFLHMCSACALTTQFAEDRFPRVISEVECDSSDCDCFTVKGTAHGRCKTMTRPVKMLRKRAGMCRLMIFKGEQVILDDWEIYDQTTRVGCECEINKNSLYAMFIPSGP